MPQGLLMPEQTVLVPHTNHKHTYSSLYLKEADTSTEHPASTRCTNNPQKSLEKPGLQLTRTNTSLSSYNKRPHFFQPSTHEHLCWDNPARDSELSTLHSVSPSSLKTTIAKRTAQAGHLQIEENYEEKIVERGILSCWQSQATALKPQHNGGLVSYRTAVLWLWHVKTAVPGKAFYPMEVTMLCCWLVGSCDSTKELPIIPWTYLQSITILCVFSFPPTFQHPIGFFDYCQAPRWCFLKSNPLARSSSD